MKKIKFIKQILTLISSTVGLILLIVFARIFLGKAEFYELVRDYWYFWVPWLLLFIFLIAIFPLASLYWKKTVKKLEEAYGFVEGGLYDVVQNDGSVSRNLTYVRIYRGNNTKNGQINVLFTRQSKYRGDYITREIVMKYNTIWQVVRIDYLGEE